MLTSKAVNSRTTASLAKVLVLALGLALVLGLGACATKSAAPDKAETAASADQVKTTKGAVYAGMTRDEMVAVLGAPDHVSVGHEFLYIQEAKTPPGDQLTEYVWYSVKPSVAAYFEFGPALEVIEIK